MAGGVIDAFFVTFGLDGSKFKRGARDVVQGQRDIENANNRTTEAEERNAQTRERSIKRSTDGYRRMRTELLALAAIFTAGAGIKSFIANTIDSAANLGYLSQNLSMSTERIKAFQMASERAGGSQEGLAAQLKESVDAIAELTTGGGPNGGMQAFFRWGGSAEDLKDGNTYLMARSKIIQGLFANDPGRAALIARQMGISEDQFNFLKQGPDAVEAMIRAQEKRIAISKKDTENALELKNQWLDFSQSLQSVTVKILTAAIPALSKLMGWAAELADKLAANKDVVAAYADAFAKFLIGIDWAAVGAEARGFAESIRSIAESIKLVIDRWDEWTGKSKVQTPGVSKMPGALRFGKRDALEADNAATGRAPSSSTGRPQNGTLAKISDGIEMFIARTLASFGVKAAGEYVRDVTGRDDYLVGPKAAAGATGAPADAQARLRALEQRDGLPPGTLDAQWKLESQRGNPKYMKSPAGAEGHFGFMPNTAKEYGLANPYDFNTSADAASRKMKNLLKYYKGDLRKASAAYNFGEGNLARTGLGGAPSETQNYSREVMRATAAAGAGGAASNSNVHIGNINVQTQATDAPGIARAIKPAVEQYTFSNNANTGTTP